MHTNTHNYDAIKMPPDFRTTTTHTHTDTQLAMHMVENKVTKQIDLCK